MTDLSEYTLLYVGRTCDSHQGRYYMAPSHRDMLVGLAEQFGRTIYLCQERPIDAATAEDATPIAHPDIQVVGNTEWRTSHKLASRVGSIINDARFLLDLDGPIVSHTYYPGFYSFLLAPVVHRVSDVSLSHFGSDALDTANAAYGSGLFGRGKRTLYRGLQSYVMRTADTVFATDPKMLAQYKPYNIVESKPVIDFDIGDIRTRDDLCESEPITLLNVGMFRPVKGQTHLVDAFHRLVEESDVEYRLRLVGEGETRAEIERQAGRLGVAESVDFTGYVGDHQELIRQFEQSDIFVIPSLKESVPRVFYEATAMGLPVVTTAVGGIPEFLDDGVDALLVPAESPERLATAIERVATDSALRATLIANAQSKVEWYLEGNPVDQRVRLVRDCLE
jgi:glycosyltransferase involved in cell wall biosynthesis